MPAPPPRESAAAASAAATPPEPTAATTNAVSEVAAAAKGGAVAEAAPRREYPVSHYFKVKAPPAEVDTYYKNPLAVSRYLSHESAEGKLRPAVRRLAKLGGFAAVLLGAFAYRVHCSDEGTVVASSRVRYLTRFLPLRRMSRAWGSAMEVELPSWAVLTYATLTGVDLTEGEHGTDVARYRTVQELFTRRLRDYAATRPLAASQVVSPCDGEVFRVGEISQETTMQWIEQVKGYRYDLEELVRYRARPVAEGKKRMYYVVYLHPGDYHRFHVPADGWTVKNCNHVPGTLLPVNMIGYKYFDELYCLNERVALNGTWDHGYMSMTAVAAYNVGNIKLAFDERLRTNTASEDAVWLQTAVSRTTNATNYVTPINPGAKGDELGHFRMGSTVVLVLDTPKDWVPSASTGDRVKMGQGLFLKPSTAGTS